jgi:hypothetical protein
LATNKNFTVKNGITVGTTAIVNSSGVWVGPSSGLIGATGVAGATGPTGPTGGLLTAGNYVIRAVKNGSSQTISNGSDTVVTFVDDFDPQGWFSSNKFQPTIAGYYNIQVAVWWEAGSVTNNQTNIQLRKNGSTQIVISQSPITTNVGNSNEINTIVYFNGSTDYVEVTAYTANPTSQNISGSANGTFFTASLYAQVQQVQQDLLDLQVLQDPMELQVLQVQQDQQDLLVLQDPMVQQVLQELQVS